MIDTDVKNISQGELDDKVKMLTKMKHYNSAAELIAAWVFWAEVKRELGLEDPQDDEDTGVTVGRGNMGEEMKNRMIIDFGPDWGRPDWTKNDNILFGETSDD